MQALHCSRSGITRPACACRGAPGPATARIGPQAQRAGPAARDGALKRLFSAPGRAAARRVPAVAPRALKQADRYTTIAKRAVKEAQKEACKLGKNYAGPEHLLLGILAEAEDAAAEGEPSESIAARALAKGGVTLKAARAGAEAVTGASGQGLTLQIVEIPLSGKAEEALAAARAEARELGVPGAVGTEHILMALLADAGGPAARLLGKLGVNLETVQDETLRMTLAETAAELDAAAKARSVDAARALLRRVFQLAYIPLAAVAWVMEARAIQVAGYPGALTVVAAALVAALCAQALAPGAHGVPAASALQSAAAGVAGWFGGRAAAAGWLGAQLVKWGVSDPRLAAAMQCCGAVLALGLAANIF